MFTQLAFVHLGPAALRPLPAARPSTGKEGGRGAPADIEGKGGPVPQG